MSESLTALENASEFVARHIGISPTDEARMLGVIGEASREALIASIVPASIARRAPMDLPPPATEAQALAELKALAARNRQVHAVKHDLRPERLPEAADLDPAAHEPNTSTVMPRFRSRMRMKAVTTALVVARPTPAAPPDERNPW